MSTERLKVLIVDDDNEAIKAALIHLLGASDSVQFATEPEPLKLEAMDRRYMVASVTIVKPKKPNFSRFQNSFKRRGR